MKFETGDLVVHPQHGVGMVVKLEIRQFDTRTAHLYYEISIPGGTLWVRVEGSSCELRKVTPKDELGKYRDVLKSRPAPLTEDYRQREIDLSGRLRQNSFRARCEVVRDLSALGWHKSLSEGNSTLLRNVRQRLDEEWAIAKGVPDSEANREVSSLLNEGRSHFKK